MVTDPFGEPDDDLDYAEYGDVEPLFRRFGTLPAGSSGHSDLRERLIVLHLPLADNIARGFSPGLLRSQSTPGLSWGFRVTGGLYGG